METSVADQFLCERNHIGQTNLANHIKNTAQMEKSLLASAPTLQRNRLSQEPLGDRLRGRTAAWPDTNGEVTVGCGATVAGFSVSCGDYVLFQDQCGRVKAAVKRVGDTYKLLVNVLVEEAEDPVLMHSKRCLCTGGGNASWALLGVQQAAAWYYEGNSAIVLHD